MLISDPIERLVTHVTNNGAVDVQDGLFDLNHA
jgi:hypothetical protein